MLSFSGSSFIWSGYDYLDNLKLLQNCFWANRTKYILLVKQDHMCYMYNNMKLVVFVNESINLCNLLYMASKPNIKSIMHNDNCVWFLRGKWQFHANEFNLIVQAGTSLNVKYYIEITCLELLKNTKNLNWRWSWWHMVVGWLGIRLFTRDEEEYGDGCLWVITLISSRFSFYRTSCSFRLYLVEN